MVKSNKKNILSSEMTKQALSELSSSSGSSLTSKEIGYIGGSMVKQTIKGKKTAQKKKNPEKPSGTKPVTIANSGFIFK